jgi:SAM-dependent methyltransferase
MNWRFKAFAQSAISAMPRSTEINYTFQKYVTRNLPPNLATMRHSLNTILSDFTSMERYVRVPLADARCFEFGAGATFLGPLTFYCLGIEHQTLVDIHRLLRSELVNCAIRFLREQQEPAFRRVPHALAPEGLKGQRLIDWFVSTYGIHYQAPCDAKDTPFDAGTFDVATSKAVLEHVPKPDIEAILTECRRVLTSSGVAAFRTDYQDHYSYCDGRVSIYNFLRYSDAEWKKYSPGLNYTNRLRHRDYLELFRAAGFEILADTTYEIRDEDLLSLSKMPRDSRFAGYTDRELAVRGAHTVLGTVSAHRAEESSWS